MSNPLPAFQEKCEGGPVADISVNASGGVGTIYSYQWYSNASNSNQGGTIATGPGNQTDTYSPQNTIIGTLYYYCVITQTASGCENRSLTAEVKITQGPSFVDEPIGTTVCLGATITALEVTYQDGVGQEYYQWYQNTINDTTSGSIIPGENTWQYLPPTTTVGTMYYYCQIRLPQGGCDPIVSIAAEITVEPDPIISIHPDPLQIICEGGKVNQLDVDYQF